MGTYTALAAAWNSSTQPPTGVTGTALTGLTTAQKIAAVNAWTVKSAPIDVEVSTVVGWLSLNAKLSGLIKYAASAPSTAAGVAGAELVAVIQCPNAPAFQTSQSAVYTTLSAMLSALAGDSNSGITSADAANLLALSTPQIPFVSAPVAQGGAGLQQTTISLNETTAAGLS